MVFFTLQSKGPLRATDFYPSFVDNETEAQRPSASRQASHSEKDVEAGLARRSQCFWWEVTFYRFTALPASNPGSGGACQQVLPLD